MSKQETSRKPLIIGIIAAVAILAVLLGLLLTQCTGLNATESTPAQTVGYLGEAEDYDLYWNLDRALYDGKSEAGMSSRKPESDGLFHVRFFIDGEIVELKVADRKTVNAIEVNDLMGLEFNDDGIVVGVISLDDMPLQQVGWKFYVQSVGGNLVKLNSAKTFNGMELLLEMLDDTGLYDMTGAEGEVGKRIIPIATDRVIAIANLEGKLTHMYIYERSEYMQSFEAECQHCKETVTWKVWNKPDKLPTATGHYQLSDNIQLKVQQAIEEDGKVCLDLNGYAVDGVDNGRVYTLHNVGANLALMDTSEEQKGVLRGHSTASPQGGVVWVRYGAFYMYSGTLDASDMICALTGTAVNVPKNAFFYMYGGTIIGGNAKYTYNAETKKYGNGLGGTISINGKMVMHGGVIRDGYAESAVSAWNADGTPKTYQRGIGGNIYVANGGEFEMHGGQILNGTANHSGGNVYLDGASTMIMNGGEIAGGQVTGKGRNGGNVFVTSKATFEFNGGSINWGVSRNCAGNLYSNGTVVMNGGYIGCGQIRDWATGKLKPTDSRTNVFQVGGSTTMFGGVIDGGYTITDTSATDSTITTLILGGMPVISGREELEYDDLVLTNGGSGVRVIVATLVNGAKIGVNATTGIFTLPTAESNTKGFYSNIDEAQIHYVDGCIALGRWACVCGSQEHYGKCDGTQLFWAPLTGSSIPGTTGNYFLAKDITITAQLATVENADVKLDLNGYTITGPKNVRALAMFNPGAKLLITDSSEGKTGVVKSRGVGTTQGNVVWVRYGEFEFYGGTLDGSEYTIHTAWAAGKDEIFGTEDDTTSGRDGGTISMGTGTTFNMYGGTIIGNHAEISVAEKTITEGEGDEAVKKTITREMSSPNGAALAGGKNAVFNMYDGVIRDGHSDARGGNICVSSNCVLNLYGGTISGGTAGLRDEEGNLVTYKDANGKTVTKSAGWGGNIDIYDSAVVNLAGTTVIGGVSGGNGGNIRLGHSKATLNMTAGMVIGGESTNDQAGNMFLSGTANLSGGVITGGKARNGGNIAINSSKTVTLNGVRVENGYASGEGGNIRLSTTQVTGELVIAEGTVISGGEAKTGGNLCVAVNNANKNNPVGTVTITGGTLENGLANGGMGGNLYAYTGVTVTMTGGELKNGVSSVSPSGGYGGNLYNNGATITISGGILQDGQAGLLAEDGQSLVFGNNDSNKKGWGGNIGMKGGALTITDEAQVLGGTAGRNGGSIYVEGGTLNVAGGTISGGLSHADQGGNIWVAGGAYLNVTGGTIKDGTTAKNGGNIHCNANANVSITGGYITGGSAYGSKTYKNANVNLYASENITIGSVKIDGYVHIASSVKLVDKPVIKGGATNLSVNGFDVDVSGLDVGSDVHMIGITDSAAGIFSGEADLGEEAYFFSDDAEKVVGFVNGKLTLDKGRLGMGRYRCLCGKTPGYEGEHALGCDGDTSRFWAAWTATDKLPTENGNWYLTASQIKFATQFAFEKDAEIAIDLNGCTVIDSDNRMLSTSTHNGSGSVTLWITDTSAEKKGVLRVTDSAYTDQGMGLWLDTTSTLNIIAGTIDASQAATSGGKNPYGAGVYVVGNSTMNMYGGTILGGQADFGGAVAVAAGSTLNVYGGTIAGGSSPKGGAIYTNGTVNLQSGSILGGTATAGGAIYVDASGSVNLTGKDASISGGVAEQGGNLYVLGSLTMTNGEIADGKAVRAAGGEGGNIRLAETASVTLSGGTITGGKAGRLAADGVTMDYGTNNDTKAGLGGNIHMANSANLAISNEALITLGTCGRNGGNVYIASGTVTMTGGQVTLGTAVVDQGGNFFNSGDLIITGGTVSGGNATNGGNIGINSNKSTVLGGDAIIRDGVATSQGGNIRMLSTMTTKCELTIEGNALISGGQARNGGNISLEVAAATNVTTMNITGGTIENGWAVYSTGGYGGNIYLSGADITITGGTVTGGKAGMLVDTDGVKSVSFGPDFDSKKGWGGNIYAANKGENRTTVNVGGNAVITDGTCGGNGGGIYCGGDLIVSGGTVSNSQTIYDNGGNIWLAGGATFSMTDGTLSGGHAKKNGGNFHTNGGNVVSFSGGTITAGKVNNSLTHNSANVNIASGAGTITFGSVEINGYVTVGNTNAVTLTGAPKIIGAADGKKNLYVASLDITLVDLTADAQVGISADAGPFTVANANAESYKTYFTSDDTQYAVEAISNQLVLGKKYCLCGDADGHADTSATNGCNGEVLFWQPWTSDSKLPTTSGNYYLTKGFTKTDTWLTDVKNQDIKLDLNDQVVLQTNKSRMVRVNGSNTHVTIIDTGANGKGALKHTGKNDQGTIIWVANEASSVTLISGIIDGSEASWRSKKEQSSSYTGEDADTWYNAHGGNTVCAAAGGTFTMWGGTILGGTTPYGVCDAIIADKTSATSASGNVFIHGGSIQAKNADNVAIRILGSLKMTGGTVVGKVEATNFRNAAKLTLSGAPVISEILLTVHDATGTDSGLDYALPTITLEGELSNADPIAITVMGNEEIAVSGTTVEANAAKFVAGDADHIIYFHEGVLYNAKYACLCGNLNGEHVGYTDPDGNFVGCNGDKIAWLPWTSTTTLPTSTGNFYLTAPVVVTGQQNYSAAGQHVVLDLNGYQVSVNSANKVRIYAVNKNDSSLVITDNYVVPTDNTDATRTGGKMIRSTSYAGEGGVVWLSNTTQQFVLIRGEMTAPADSACADHGGLLSINGKFYMLGGYLHGGVTTTHGGNLSVRNSVTYMVDGTITGGTAKNGGNINVEPKARFVMLGGTVSNGTAPNGNAIRAFGAVELRGGTITGQTMMLNWNQNTAALTLSGDAEVEGIYLNRGKDNNNVDLATIVLPAITIEGELTGTTVTKITTLDGTDHYFATTDVEANAQRFTTSYEGKAIHYIDGKLYLGKYNCLCGGNGNTDTANGGTCVGATEGCDSQLHIWTLWTSTNTRPDADGYYYLNQDIELKGTPGSILTARTIAIDLNGHDIKTKITNDASGRIYNTNTAPAAEKINFIFTNTADDPSAFVIDDTGRPEGEGSDQGVIVWAAGGTTTVTAYNVNADLTKMRYTDGVSYAGAAYSGGANSNIKLYGVCISGGTNVNGGALAIGSSGNMLLHDTVVTGNKIGVHVNTGNAKSKLILSGTTYISGNTESNLKLNSNVQTVVLAEGYTGTAGQVTGITSAKIGDVLKGETAALTHADKALFATDDTMVLGLVDGKLQIFAAGTHIHCICGGTMTDGQVLADGTTHNCQDIIFTPVSGDVDGSNQIVGVTANWYLADDVQITGTHYRLKNCNINLCLNGHNWNGKKDARAIAFQEGTNTMSITTCQADQLDANGVPTNNRIVPSGTSNQGMGIWVRYGHLNLYAGHVDATNAKGSNGVGIYIEPNGCSMTMYNGSVFGGTSKEASGNFYGANVYVNSATFNMLGGKIYNGNAKTEGGNLCIANGTVNMYGGLITDGKVGGVALRESANVCMSGTGKLNISGGEITGGIAGFDNSTNATVAVSGSARLTNPSSGSSNGYYRLIINNSGTAGKPRISLVIGQLNDDAIVRLTMKKTSDLPFVGQFATAAENYTITQNDFKKVTFWWHGGPAISDKYTAVLKDNGLWSQEK